MFLDITNAAKQGMASSPVIQQNLISHLNIDKQHFNKTRILGWQGFGF